CLLPDVPVASRAKRAARCSRLVVDCDHGEPAYAFVPVLPRSESNPTAPAPCVGGQNAKASSEEWSSDICCADNGRSGGRTVFHKGSSSCSAKMALLAETSGYFW